VELQGRVKALQAQGLGLATISYDSREVLAAFAKQHGITYTMLSDAGSATIKRYGILNTVVAEAFGPNKDDPARLAHTLRPRPWTVQVDGLVARPKSYDVDELLRFFPLEERVYRLRCVEGWSMVIPWIGYPLASLIKRVEPLGKARFVEFTTLLDPEQFPGQRKGLFNFTGLDWPYVEGLRLDEALHPLALLTFGLYGQVLPNQNGAPVRVVVPWKYGFKSAKSIVRIRFVSEQPRTAWEKAAPQEYGFYSNVNPTVDHPRWSQATERRIGEFRRRKTLMFNGYTDQVASLYAGMDLRKHY